MNAPQAIVRFYNDAHHCGWTTDGRDWQAVGCSHLSPRQAVDHSDSIEGKEDSHARIPADYLRREVVDPADVIPTSRSVPDRLTPPYRSAGENSGLAQNETPGHPIAADGPRRPAPTGTFPPGPVGAPRPRLVTQRRHRSGDPGRPF